MPEQVIVQCKLKMAFFRRFYIHNDMTSMRVIHLRLLLPLVNGVVGTNCPSRIPHALCSQGGTKEER